MHYKELCFKLTIHVCFAATTLYRAKKGNNKQREKGSVGNGWSVQGLQKFNEIAEQVKMDRNNFG